MQSLTSNFLLAILCSMIMVVPSYSQPFKSDFWFPVTVEGKVGYIDRSGSIVIEPMFDGGSYSSEGLATVSVGRDTIFTAGFSQGFVNESGDVVIQPQWDVVSSFSEGLAAVGYDQTKKEFKIGNRTYYTSASHTWYRWGFIDKRGQMVVSPRFTDVSEFREGVAAAGIPIMSEWKMGFIDIRGNWVIEPKFDDANQFSEGLARVFVNGKYGFIDKNGEMVIPAKYSFARDFSEGVACVKLGGDVIRPKGMSTIRHNADYAFIDKAGKILFKVGKGGCESFSEGFARVAVGGGHRVIDKTGRFVFDPALDVWADFKNGLAEVYLIGKEIGFIDTSGKIVLKGSFGMAEDFYRGLAKVCDSSDFGAKCGYIDRSGELIWAPSR